MPIKLEKGYKEIVPRVSKKLPKTNIIVRKRFQKTIENLREKLKGNRKTWEIKTTEIEYKNNTERINGTEK